MSRKPVRDLRWMSGLLTLILLTVHAGLCWRMIGGWAGIKTRYPVLTDDHTFNYYYAVTSRNYLAQHCSTAGYDPFFMSGYAKSIIFPSSSTLAELVVWCFGGEYPERAYKLYVFLAAAICPAVIWAAVRLWARSAEAALLALVMYLALFWSDIGEGYIAFGMVSYVLGGVVSVLATSFFVRYLTMQEGTPRAAFGWWLAIVVGLSIAAMTHVTVPLALGPAWAVLILVRWRKNWWRLLAMLGAAVLVILANAFWLFPGVFLLETYGRTDTGFVNSNVSERLLELLRWDWPIETLLLGLTLFGWPLWRRRLEASSLLLLLLLSWSFFLGFIAGWFRDLDFLQPGRYTQYFFLFAIVPASMVIHEIWCRLRGKLRKGLALLTGGLGLAGMLMGAIYVSRLQLEAVLSDPPVLLTTLPPNLEELIVTLRRVSEPGERLLFEERNLGLSVNGQQLVDPYQAVRLGPLLPLLTGLEVIGGPYLQTHQVTNFSQAGDGKFLGDEGWDAERFARFARLYDFTLIACWSPQARRFCGLHPELVEPITSIGPAWSPILVGRVRRQGDATIIGNGKVSAAPGEIRVHEAAATDGKIVLRYHWTPHLVSDPPLEIREHPLEEDPVGLMEIRNPPERFSIRLDPYQPLRRLVPSRE